MVAKQRIFSFVVIFGILAFGLVFWKTGKWPTVYVARISGIRTSGRNQTIKSDTWDPLNNKTLEEEDNETKLLTLFTTFKPLWHTWELSRNTLRIWNELAPLNVAVILYVEESNVSFWEEEARNFTHWRIYPAPAVLNRLPIIRKMFLHAMNVSKSVFYGYANGDLLFTPALVDTLNHLKEAITWPKVMITSMRTGYKVKRTERITNFDEVVEKARKGSLFRSDAEDIFITKADSYPWTEIPDFVVGRVGFDNWLIANALLKGIAVIDVTDTVLCLHQSDEFTGDTSSWQIKEIADREVNKLLLKGSPFPYYLGCVTCIPLKTAWDKEKRLKLMRRSINDKICLKLYKGYKINLTAFHDACVKCG